MIGSWRQAWDEFVPFLEFPPELRRVVYTTNAVESLNARFRRAVRHRGHFPNEQAAMKVQLPCRHRPTQEPHQPGRQDQRLDDHLEHLDRPLRRPHRRPHPMNTITAGHTKNLTGTLRSLARSRSRWSCECCAVNLALRNQAGTSGSDSCDGLSLAWSAAGGEQDAQSVVAEVGEASC